MKKYAIILLLSACTAARISTPAKTVILDASPSYISGGDGKGYFTGWQWQQTEGNAAVINNPGLPTTTAVVSGNGIFAWRLKVTDNLNQSDTATLKINVDNEGAKGEKKVKKTIK